MLYPSGFYILIKAVGRCILCLQPKGDLTPCGRAYPIYGRFFFLVVNIDVSAKCSKYIQTIQTARLTD